jgi:hypothetical protein
MHGGATGETGRARLQSQLQNKKGTPIRKNTILVAH